MASPKPTATRVSPAASSSGPPGWRVTTSTRWPGARPRSVNLRCTLNPPSTPTISTRSPSPAWTKGKPLKPIPHRLDVRLSLAARAPPGHTTAAWDVSVPRHPLFPLVPGVARRNGVRPAREPPRASSTVPAVGPGCGGSAVCSGARRAIRKQDALTHCRGRKFL